MERRRRVRVPLERRPGEVQAGAFAARVTIADLVPGMIVVVVVEVRRVVMVHVERRIVVQFSVHMRQLAARVMVDDHTHLGRRNRNSEARRHQRDEIESHGGHTPGSEDRKIVCLVYESRPITGCDGDGRPSTASMPARL
jgi:hypothetical protein